MTKITFFSNSHNMNYFFVGLGGAIGAILRTLISQLLPTASFPFQVVIVNFLGCFMMGVAFEIISHRSDTPIALYSLLIPGFLGAFTTFATFALDFTVLYQKGDFLHSLVYALVSIAVCFISLYFGVKLARAFI